MVQKIDRTLVQITAENLTALVAADFSGGRNFVEIDGLAVVAVNIRHHITLYEKIRLLRFCGRSFGIIGWLRKRRHHKSDRSAAASIS